MYISLLGGPPLRLQTTNRIKDSKKAHVVLELSIVQCGRIYIARENLVCKQHNELTQRWQATRLFSKSRMQNEDFVFDRFIGNGAFIFSFSLKKKNIYI